MKGLKQQLQEICSILNTKLSHFIHVSNKLSASLVLLFFVEWKGLQMSIYSNLFMNVSSVGDKHMNT